MAVDLETVREDDVATDDRLDKAATELEMALESAEIAADTQPVGDDLEDRREAVHVAFSCVESAHDDLERAHAYLSAGDEHCPRCDGNLVELTGREGGSYCRRCDVVEGSPPPSVSSARKTATALSLAGIAAGGAMMVVGPWRGSSTPVLVLGGSAVAFYALEYGDRLVARVRERLEEVAG